MYRPGIIVVGHQTISLGSQWCSRTVTVLLEDDWLRVVAGGRQITAVPRRHLTPSGRIHGVVVG